MLTQGELSGKCASMFNFFVVIFFVVDKHDRRCRTTVSYVILFIDNPLVVIRLE
jgi:hypothetical protein